VRVGALVAAAALAAACGSDGPEAAPGWTRSGPLGDAGARRVALAVDDAGRGLAAWQVAGASGAALAVAEETSAGAWSLRAPAAGTPGAPQAPDVATGPEGTALAVYWQQDGDASRVQWSERSAAGGWTDRAEPDETLSLPPRAYEPRAGAAPTGEEAIVWNQWIGSSYVVLFARRRARDAPWEIPTDESAALSLPIFFSNAPQLAMNDRGDVLIAWYQSTGGPLRVYAAERRGLDGEFVRPAADAALSAPGAPVDSHPVANPRPAYGPDGQAAVVWTQEDGRGATPVYVAVREPEGAWQAPADLDDALPPATGVARCAQSFFRATGELVVVWEQEHDGAHEVLALALAGGARSAGAADLVTLSAPGADGLSPVVAVRGDEGIAAWLEQRPAGTVVVARRLGAGWGPPASLSDEDEEARPPALAASATRLLVAWPQGPMTEERVHVASLDL